MVFVVTRRKAEALVIGSDADIGAITVTIEAIDEDSICISLESNAEIVVRANPPIDDIKSSSNDSA